MICLLLKATMLIVSTMSTLAEIESALDRLTVAEQEELMRHLAQRLRHQPGVTQPASREAWMRRLEELRASIGSARSPTLQTEQILERLREERG
jgi:hypothetical protein